MKYFVKALQNYANFKGRATRPEYWYFYLFYFIISVGGRIGVYFFEFSWLGTILVLPLIIPFLAVGVRRMHDVDKSGWYILIPIYNLILHATRGTEGDNRYGPDPNAPEYTFDFENKEAGV